MSKLVFKNLRRERDCMKQQIVLDEIVNKRGRRVDGFINYGQKPDMSHYQIPVIIVEGGHPGEYGV